MNSSTPLIINTLNRRLADSLGMVCGGSKPRFSWLYAPDQPYFIYDLDDRSLIRKCWADATRSSGLPVGKSWLLAEWRRTTAYDHCGFGNGVRVPVAREFGYAPYFETALPPGILPTPELNQNFISVIAAQLDRSIEFDPFAVKNIAIDGMEKAQAAERKEASAWLNNCRADYDNETGAFGNLSPGRRDGFMSFLNNESGPEASERRNRELGYTSASPVP